MALHRACLDSVLTEFEAGYIFSPYGAYGKAVIISRSSSSGILFALSFFCVSVWPVLGLIVASGLYQRISHNVTPLLISFAVGLGWMACFAIWAKLATRGHIEFPRHACR